MRELPLISPNPPRLSRMTDRLEQMERSGIFSNRGPIVREFEESLVARLFGGQGACLAVGNATIGLTIAIRQAAGPTSAPGALALMPSFTFAATAHAAQWAGLTPLLCDSDPRDWAACAAAEERLLQQYGDRVAVIVPYATFGTMIDLERYRRLAERYGVGVVIDGAASLGTTDAQGRNFGAGYRFATVFSMHATKTFATGEGGVIYSADAALVENLRQMTNFGFAGGRSAEGPGLNAKLPEVLGLLALGKLDEIDAICAHREALQGAYRDRLAGFTMQRAGAGRQATQFMSLLLPERIAPARDRLIAMLAAEGVGSAHYFSPHLAQQPWFRASCVIDDTPVADDIGRRILSLPVTDGMTIEDVGYVCDTVRTACALLDKSAPRATSARVRAKAGVPHYATLMIGGGPAGTAMLTAASKQGKLAALAGGLAIVEAGDALGGGKLGGYAITSDSTAETFLSAVKNNPHAEIAALERHASGAKIAEYLDALGVPLVHAGPFLRETGARLHDIVAANGGAILTGHKALHAQRLSGGLWRARIRERATGVERDVTATNIVLATGGYQSDARIAEARVAGVVLAEHLGERLVKSDEVLRIGGLDALRARLSQKRAPRIAIIGGSTSALAACALLLKASPAWPLGQGAVTLLHRRPLRPFYHSAEAALADGFDDFTPDDICPVSGFVYRLAGFRLEARDLVLRMLEIGGRVPDPRLRAHRISEEDEAATRAILDEADIVIAALGYRPHALPLFDAASNRLALAADGPGAQPLVDRHCRVIDAQGQPVAGAFGIGLAAGFVPWGALGGEPSFAGQANGLWLWQNDVGQMIVDQVLGQRRRDAA